MNNTIIIRTLFFVAGTLALYFSQSQLIPLSWAIFLCFVAGICIAGVFAWQSKPKHTNRWDREDI